MRFHGCVLHGSCQPQSKHLMNVGLEAAAIKASLDGGKTVDQALSEQGSWPQQLPAELLDEQIPESDVGQLLPPLPDELRSQTRQQAVEEERPKEGYVEAGTDQILYDSGHVHILGMGLISTAMHAGPAGSPRKACILPSCFWKCWTRIIFFF